MTESISSCRFAKGDEVCHRQQRDLIGVVVGEPRIRAGRWWLDVNFSGRRRSMPESALERAVRSSNPSVLIANGNWGGPETLARMLTFTKLETPLRDVLYAFRATRTQFEPYQFRPLMKFLESPSQRLLIADEVGLGKTIEAGYLLRELKARHPNSFRRVLIVCPASLQQKWQQEMERRFEEPFEIKSAAEFRRHVLTRDPSEASRLQFQFICSIQSLRGRRTGSASQGDLADWQQDDDAQPSLLDEIEAGCPTLDLVVVDEAHHMRNPGTLHHRLGVVLSEKADAMVLLTATPIQIGSDNLFNLLHILEPQEFADVGTFNEIVRANEVVIDAQRLVRAGRFVDALARLEKLETDPFLRRLINASLFEEVRVRLRQHEQPSRRAIVEAEHDLMQLNTLSHVFTRTRKRDVIETPPVRSPHVIQPDWSPAEAAFYDSVSEYCCELYSRHHGEFVAQFAVVGIQRQMASSIPAMLQRFRGHARAPLSADGLDDTDELAEGDPTRAQEQEYSIYSDPAFVDLVNQSAEDITIDSKWEALARTLREIDRQGPDRKVVVFSFFKATLAYLEHRFREAGIESVTISGDVPSRPNDPPRDERGQRIRRFHEDPTVRVLLSSEVGGEGLDFHTKCHILVNYDLPWNPMRLEQRIGRLDRFGQPSDRILIFNFAIPNTVEDRILTRLYERIGIFRRSIGDLESILGDELREIERVVMSSNLTWEEKESRSEQRAMALENRIRLSEQFEEAATQFIGQDSYFDEQIRGIQRERRFVTPAEMASLISDFLDRELDAPWRAAETPGVYRIRWNRALETFLSKSVPREDLARLRFRDLDYGETFECTCEDELAYRRADLEYLSLRHPLVQAIQMHMRSRQADLHSVAALAVPAPGPEAEYGTGRYFYAIYMLEQLSELRSGQYLEPVFVPLGGESAQDEGGAYELMHAMVTTGLALASSPDITAGTAARLIDEAEQMLIERRNRRQEEQQRLNGIAVQRRLASLKVTYEGKIRRMQQRLTAGESRQLNERYLRMLRGSLRNLEAELSTKISEIERGRHLEITHELRACGVVEVR